MRGNLAFWKDRARELDFKLAAFCNLCRVLDGFRKLRKKEFHLLRRAEVEFPFLVFHPVLVTLLGLGSNADQGVVGIPVILFDVMDVVGAYQRHARLPGEDGKFLKDDSLFVQPMVLDFKVVSVPKDFFEPANPFPCFIHFSCQYKSRNLS